jgi:DNA polymerase-1
MSGRRSSQFVERERVELKPDEMPKSDALNVSVATPPLKLAWYEAGSRDLRVDPFGRALVHGADALEVELPLGAVEDRARVGFWSVSMPMRRRRSRERERFASVSFTVTMPVSSFEIATPVRSGEFDCVAAASRNGLLFAASAAQRTRARQHANQCRAPATVDPAIARQRSREFCDVTSAHAAPSRRRRRLARPPRLTTRCRRASAARGRPGNALLGFSNFMLRLWQSEEPRAVLVGWDSLDTPTYRHELFAGYQAAACSTTTCSSSSTSCPSSSARSASPPAKAPGYEADDFLAAAARKEEKRGGTALVVTSDRDSFQLASEQTTILQPTRGVSELARIGPAEVRERYGVDPAQVPDFIALRGDPSDKMPGARGVGPKTAASLLAQYGSLEAMLDDGRFGAQAEELRMYRRMATLDASAPLPPLKSQTPKWAEASAFVRELGLNALADRVAALSK